MPSGGVPSADVVGDAILRSLRQILRKVSEHSRFLSRSGGLTVPQFLCLRAIATSPGDELSVAEIAELVQLSSPTVSRIIDRLERAGYVQRKRRSDDRRKLSISLSRSGQERLAQLPLPLHERFVERLNRMDALDRDAIRLALDKLVLLLDASDIDAAPVLMPGVDPNGAAVPEQEQVDSEEATEGFTEGSVPGKTLTQASDTPDSPEDMSAS